MHAGIVAGIDVDLVKRDPSFSRLASSHIRYLTILGIRRLHSGHLVDSLRAFSCSIALSLVHCGF